MLDIIKILIEKPEDIRRHIISFLNILLTAIVASKLYELLFGEFTPILIGDEGYWKDMYQFLFSGRVLIVAMLFFFVKFIAFEISAYSFFKLFNWLAKRNTINSDKILHNNILNFLLVFFKVLKFDRGNLPIPEKNFNNLLEFINKEKKENIHKDIKKVKETTLFEIFNLYFLFAIVYYFIMIEFHKPIISISLVIGFLFLFSQLFFFEFIFHVIETSYDNFSTSLRYIHQIHITNDFLKKHNLIPINMLQKKKSIYEHQLKTQNIDYAIIHFFNKPKIIQHIKRLKNTNKNVILIVTEKNKHFYLKQLDISSIKVIFFNEKEQFIIDLENIFFSNFLKIK